MQDKAAKYTQNIQSAIFWTNISHPKNKKWIYKVKSKESEKKNDTLN